MLDRHPRARGLGGRIQYSRVAGIRLRQNLSFVTRPLRASLAED
jgi:hypothetical protein